MNVFSSFISCLTPENKNVKCLNFNKQGFPWVRAWFCGYTPLGCSFIVHHASKPCGTAGEASLLARGMANKL